MTDMPSLMRLAAGAARHAASRQAVIATNVANADTPGFLARDMTAFDPFQTDMILRRTRPQHFAGGELAPRAEVRRDAMQDPNGNSVSLEDEILRSVDVGRSHGRAIAVYSAALDIMRASIGRR